MVDNRAGETNAPRLRRRYAVALVAAGLVTAVALVLGAPTVLTQSSPSTPKATQAAVDRTVRAVVAVAKDSTTTPAVAVASTPAPAATPTTTTPPVSPESSTAALVAQVEAAGIVPGPNWSWSMGDTAALCGVTSSANVAAGCTSWSSGVIRTAFDGTPTLALVAHEVANAETEQFAIPTLLQDVGAAAGSTSWSPTDAVSSCLVAHFLGFQDGAAGSWECPATLAASVAAHIHDVVVTNQTTAICGTTSGISSTLTFTAGTGTLTVTSPTASPQIASPGGAVTVSGVGTFTGKDVGGTATVIGVCQG